MRATMPADLGQRFDDEIRLLIHERIGIALVVGAFVFPLFVFQDYFMMPERWRQMLILRLACSLACILAMSVGKTDLGKRHPFAVVLFAAASISVTKTFITPLAVEGLRSIYFAGHAMIIAGGLALLPLSTGQAVALGLTCHLGFLLPMLLFASPLHWVAFLVQNTYLFSIWSLLCIGCRLNYQLRMREFDLRQKLSSVRQRVQEYY